MIGRIAFALTGLILGVFGGPGTFGVTAAPAPTARSDTVNVGDVFIIPISVADVQDVTSFQFDLAFDPPLVKAPSFTDIGTDFATAAENGGGFLAGITGFIDNTTGILSGGADSMSGLLFGAGLPPGGVLGDIDFQALAIEASPLLLSNAFLTDDGVSLSSTNSDFMAQNGQVAARRNRVGCFC